MTDSWWGQLLGKQTSIGRAKSSSLNSIQWAFVVALIGVLLGIFLNATPHWLLIILSICFVLAFLMLGYGFIYLLHTNPDALRSEQFVIKKLEVERKLVGDSDTGMRQIDQPISTRITDGILEVSQLDKAVSARLSEESHSVTIQSAKGVKK